MFEFMKQFFLRNSIEEALVNRNVLYIYPRLLEECLKENRMSNQRSALSSRKVSDALYISKIANSGQMKAKFSEMLKSFKMKKRFTLKVEN